MGNYTAIDNYRLVMTVDTEEAEKNIKDVDRFMQKFGTTVNEQNKITSKSIKNMNDKEFSFLYQNMDAFKDKVDKSAVSMRFLTRGLQGFKMNMLNTLFLGMALSSVFNGMRASTAMGQVFSSLGGILSEVTLGQSSILSFMVSSISKLINYASANPDAAKLIGDIGVSLGLLGTAMVAISSITMFAGGLLGTEGLVPTLIAAKDLLTGGEGVVGLLESVAKFAKAGLSIAIGFEVYKLFTGDDKRSTITKLLDLAGIRGLMALTDWAAVSGLTAAAGIAGGILLALSLFMPPDKKGKQSIKGKIATILGTTLLGYRMGGPWGAAAGFVISAFIEFVPDNVIPDFWKILKKSFEDLKKNIYDWWDKFMPSWFKIKTGFKNDVIGAFIPSYKYGGTNNQVSNTNGSYNTYSVNNYYGGQKRYFDITDW